MVLDCELVEALGFFLDLQTSNYHYKSFRMKSNEAKWKVFDKICDT
jgi:hypothetical protein